MKNRMLVGLSSVCVLVLFLLLPTGAFAVEWSELITALNGNDFYSYESGSASISGDTLTISGGSIQNVKMIQDAWDLNVSNILFQNVEIEYAESMNLQSGSKSNAYRVEFDKNTTVKAGQLIISTYDDDGIDTSLSVINNGTIQTTYADTGHNLVHIDAAEKDTITFINNGSITTHSFGGYVSEEGHLAIEQNGICTITADTPWRFFYCLAEDEGVLYVSNTNQIIGGLHCWAEDNASLTVNNSGSVSGKICYYTDSTKNAMAFSHSGSVGEEISLDLRGNYDFSYHNTGSAGKGMFLQVWGDTTINGLHSPAAGTPEIAELDLYPYFTITSEEEALAKAKMMYDQLQHLNVDRMNNNDIFVRNRFKMTDFSNQDDYKNVFHFYDFFPESENQLYTGIGDLTFGTNGDYKLLRRVLVDQTLLPKSAYTAWSGSTYIKLHEDFLKTLEPGVHSLRVEYLGGDARTEFTIASGNAGITTKPPKTGDDSRPILWLTLLLLSLITIVYLKKSCKTA